MWPEVAARVEAIREGRSLWLCGHSLGGALATLAADRLTGVTGVFTFGSPAVGDARFASRWNVPGKRFRNFTDIVPWLPMLKYRHVKSGVYFNSAGELVPEPNDLRLLLDAMVGFAV
jgi:pimeloyl-ACP methyl ester carboxylesterase